MQFFIAVLVFVVVTLAVFAAMSLLDQRKAQARVLRDRLSTVQKPTEQARAGRGSAARRSAQPDTGFRHLAAPLGARLRFCKKCWRRETSMFAPETS